MKLTATTVSDGMLVTARDRAHPTIECTQFFDDRAMVADVRQRMTEKFARAVRVEYLGALRALHDEKLSAITERRRQFENTIEWEVAAMTGLSREIEQVSDEVRDLTLEMYETARAVRAPLEFVP